MTEKYLEQAHFAIIGRGRISHHIPNLFSSYFLDRNILPKFEYFDRLTVYENLDLTKTKGVFLTVKDKDILEVYEKVKNFFPKFTNFYHLSGALFYSDIIGVHPLMTFSNNVLNINYQNIPIFTDNLAFYEKYKNKVNTLNFISPSLKTEYHAMAVMLGNFTQLYLQIVKNNFSEYLNFKDFKLLTEQSVASIFFEDSIERLTGPIARGDEVTIQKHKSQLADVNPKLFSIYNQMSKLLVQEL